MMWPRPPHPAVATLNHLKTSHMDPPRAGPRPNPASPIPALPQCIPLHLMYRNQDVLRTGKVRESARVGGFEGARSVLSLYARKVRDDTLLWRASPEDTLQAQCEFVGKLELDEKGKPELMARQIFNDDEKLYFARGLKLYADMGWPMSVKQIAALMQDAAQRKATRKGVRILLYFPLNISCGTSDMCAYGICACA